MTGTSHEHAHRDHVDVVAMLVRSVPVRLVEISRGGCRLECASRLESGTSGLLAVQLAGLLRIDDIRIARCQSRVGAGPVFQVGAELLKTRRLGRRTVRMAVRRIISEERELSCETQNTHPMQPGEVRPTEVNGRSDGRGPPPMSDRGS